jgi:hypothetical protein
MTLPTRAECGPAPVVICSAAVAPPPTLRRQWHSLRAWSRLVAWFRKHLGRAVYSVAVWEGWRR